MTDIKIINKSDYDKTFHKKIAKYNIFYDSNILPSVLIIITLIVLAIQSLTLKEYIYALVMGLFAIIIFPSLFFLLPYYINVNRYKTMMKKTKGKPFIINIEISNNNIKSKTSLGETFVIQYNQIREIVLYNNEILIIKTEKGKPLYIKEDSYIQSTPDICHKFLQKKTNITIIKKGANR